MQGCKFRVQGHWAQFRKPETNNNPLTHDFITKTALIGLIGAVLGKQREEMRSLFPILSTDLLYGVQISGVVKKESWAFTMRNVNKQNEKAPRQMEFLRDPNFVVVLALADVRSLDVFTRFVSALQNNEACYTPVLGLHNCPAELEWLTEGDFAAAQGEYRSKGFVLRSHKLSTEFDFRQFRLGFERIPSYQNDDWWNQPDGYRDVIYPTTDAEVAVIGDHYQFSTGEAWCLI